MAKNTTNTCGSHIPFLCQFVRESTNIETSNELDPRYFSLRKLNAEPGTILSDEIIIIFTRKNDPETSIVCSKLLDRGIDYIRLNIEDLLNIEVVGSVNENSNSPYMKIKSNGMEVDIVILGLGG